MSECQVTNAPVETVEKTRTLCDYCRKIPFKEIQQNPKQKLNTKIGTYEELKQTLCCPFCYLIFESICTLARQYALSRRIEYKGPDPFIEEHSFSHKIMVSWQRYYFDNSITADELRFVSGECPRLGCVVSPIRDEVDAIMSLLQHCDAAHDCSKPTPYDKRPRTRAIDVRRMCVTSIAAHDRYLALSYVWGGVPVARLLQDNKEKLMLPYGLEEYAQGLPKTIQDAIRLARQMKVNYLWVDALCLVQDDPEDLNVGIIAMSAIYKNAYLTIIAADGHDANAGLPGVSLRGTEQLVVEVVPGVQLVSVSKANELIDEIHYSHRAWTFQEYHFSQRKLIFLNGIMYYQCMESFWGEDRNEQPIYPEFQTFASDLIKPDRRVDQYTDILNRYTTRQATYQYDVVNAMVSVYHKVLEEFDGGHLFCVPIAAFDWFLCFSCDDNILPYVERREMLPSWAWSGWRGKFWWRGSCIGDKAIVEWATKSTWIIWHAHDSAGNMSVIWTGSQKYKSESSKRRILTERIANSSRFSADTLPFGPSRQIPHGLQYNANLLQFWTLSASFDLRFDQKGQDYLDNLGISTWKARTEVYDEANRYCGMILVDEKSLACDHDAAELIVISEGCWTMYCDYGGFYSPKEIDFSERGENAQWYNVLYIVEKSGIAERRGFGQIYMEAITISPDCPWTWKEIILG
ncbi:heterokaryon incompatibility protein-domain-containing protein [Astrocystis sublimbata]|nr:heterokaryon incompatibility protein-domain-containing protein [Astrocystis sublimbata]